MTGKWTNSSNLRYRGTVNFWQTLSLSILHVCANGGSLPMLSHISPLPSPKCPYLTPPDEGPTKPYKVPRALSNICLIYSTVWPFLHTAFTIYRIWRMTAVPNNTPYVIFTLEYGTGATHFSNRTVYWITSFIPTFFLEHLNWWYLGTMENVSYKCILPILNFTISNQEL